MRLSAAAGLVLGSLLLLAVPQLAQLDAVTAQPDAAYTQPQAQDAHLRLSGVRAAQLGQGLQGPAATYVGLGAAAEAALGDAEQVAEALLAADDATTATRKSIASLQSGGRKHRRVRHGKHSHKHKKDDRLAAYEQKEQLMSSTPEDMQYGIPSEEQHQQYKWGSDDTSSYRGSSSGHYSKSSTDDDDASDGVGGGRKRYKKQHRGGSSGGSGSDDWFGGAGGGGSSSGKDGSNDADSSYYYKNGGSGGGAEGDSTYGSGAGGGDSYPGSYSPLPPSNKNICKQVLLEEEEVEVVFTPNKDKATITTLLATCANPNHPLPTLGGGCVVECQHVEDLCNITPLNSHVFLAPANFKSIDNYYPVMCSYRADGPLKGSCNIVMKVACCSDVPKSYDTDDYTDKAAKAAAAAVNASPMHKVSGKPASSGYSGDEYEEEEGEGEYYAVVKSKLLRIPLAGHKY